jgi:ethanolaminephosphotransferase
LYLSAFSGPVEGILLIVLLYLVTGFAGPQLWVQTIRSTFGLSPDLLPFIPDIQINHFLVAFGTIGFIGNIATAYVSQLITHCSGILDISSATKRIFSRLKLTCFFSRS